MAISRAAAITGSRSGSRAPRSMASSSARATSNGMRSSTSGWMRRRRACTSLPWGGEAIGSARPISASESSQPIGPRKSTTRRAASMARSVRLASFSISAQPASVIGALSRKRWFVVIWTPVPSRSASCRCPGCRRCWHAVAAFAAAPPCSISASISVIGPSVNRNVLRCWDNLGSPRRSHSSTIAACSFSSSRLCSRMARRSGLPVALARWLYQSTASSSSIRETMARCWSITSGPSLLASSCSTSLDIRPPSSIRANTSPTGRSGKRRESSPGSATGQRAASRLLAQRSPNDARRARGRIPGRAVTEDGAPLLGFETKYLEFRSPGEFQSQGLKSRVPRTALEIVSYRARGKDISLVASHQSDRGFECAHGMSDPVSIEKRSKGVEAAAVQTKVDGAIELLLAARCSPVAAEPIRCRHRIGGVREGEPVWSRPGKTSPCPRTRLVTARVSASSASSMRSMLLTDATRASGANPRRSL